jgi:hypothetical protein
MSIVDRAKNIILTPKTEWPVIAGESADVTQLFTRYVLPLALIPAAATLIRIGVFTGYLRLAIAMSLFRFISALIVVFLVSFIVDFLAPKFASQKDFARAFQLIAYSYTASWVAGVLLIIPVLGDVLAWVASLYCIYVMYLGLPHMMKTPQDKVIIYLVVSIVAVIVVYLIINVPLWVILAVAFPEAGRGF